jgi:NADPH2:quinone reductase
MKAIAMMETGGPEVLVLRDLDEPTPQAGEVVVKLDCAGVNYIDTYHRRGVYPIDFPFTPGQEGAGTISAVGDGVTDWSVGDRVCWSMSGGSYAEFARVPAYRLAAIPDEMSSTVAAASLLQGLTAHYLTTSVYPVEKGTITVVHAVAGGVGLLLTQMIAAKGGVVIGTTSSEEKAQKARDFGAHHVIRYDEDDWVSKVREIAGEHGVDVVYDGVGADTFEGGLSVLRPRGVMALFGASSGQVPPFDLQRLSVLGSLVVTRPSLGNFIDDPDEFRWRTSELFEAISQGTLDISIAKEFPLAEAAEAHRALQSREYSGKILLVP